MGFFTSFPSLCLLRYTYLWSPLFIGKDHSGSECTPPLLMRPPCPPAGGTPSSRAQHEMEAPWGFAGEKTTQKGPEKIPSAVPSAKTFLPAFRARGLCMATAQALPPPHSGRQKL